MEYPELSEHGREVTQKIIDRFRENLEDVFNKTIREFTCNISEEIDVDDTWIDFRINAMDALKGYVPEKYGYWDQDWVQIRKKIFEENREAIVNDTILDLEKQIENLKRDLERERERYRSSHYGAY